MSRDLLINQLANDLSTKEMTKREWELHFEKLYTEVYSTFDSIIRAYIVSKNLTGFSFDVNDYISILGQSLMESIKGYSMYKGDFMARLRCFANKRFKNITQYNLAEKRFDKKKQVYSYEELPESAEFAMEDEITNSDTPHLIGEFIKQDKDGEVIKLLYMYTGAAERRQALENYFGGEYNSAARKRVQRVRERLAKHLSSNGVSI